MSSVNSENDQMSTVDTVSWPSIFKLNAYCFFDWFDWLSINEMMKLRVTCKRIKQAVDYYITKEAKYQSTKIRGIKIRDFDSIENDGHELINHLDIIDQNFAVSQIGEKQQLLAQVESIEIDWPLKNCEFHDFLKNCTRLKHLKLYCHYDEDMIANENEWLRRKYPTVEHIEINDWYYENQSNSFELKSFFEQNPNVRSFSCTPNYLWKNQHWMLASDIKIERLDIKYIDSDYSDYDGVGLVCNLLKDLHERGFYQRLSIHIPGRWYLGDYRQILSLRSLVYLYPGYDEIWSVLPPLPDLKELVLYHEYHADIMINSITNIQRISIWRTSIDGILPFIQRCLHLKQIRIENLEDLEDDGPHAEKGIIDLLTLNKEREKLANSRKITIFVREDIFLENKWKQKINLSLIELKSIHLWKLIDPFYYPY